MAVQVTGPVLPGKPPAGTVKANPPAKTLRLKFPGETRVTHCCAALSKLVVVVLAAGSKMMRASGAGRV
ncbi:hypothetical protein [Candidatus Amarolinea dominans]|uniref:hypothetical protein n=1 Tax=Candidatus Amarolinea dominans TaxID=3140696 RepID=UPI0031CCA998